jgi:threonine/homoserine/homoserine lactone efflux protein
MLLQFAIGPMCLMVFNTSVTYGFTDGLVLVLSIAFIDALYIGLSGVGVASIISKEKVKTFIKIAGCIVLLIFGINTILGAVHLSYLHYYEFLVKPSKQNIFVQGIVLTASNPLTIIFWSGAFSGKVIENKWNIRQLFFFAVGCILSTLTFLTIVAFVGSITNKFLPQLFIQILNVIVGIFLMYFGVRLMAKK